MTTATTGAIPPTAHTAAPAAPPSRAVLGLATRQVRRGTLIVLVVVAGMSALVAVQYRATFSDALDSSSLAALAENPAIRTLFGRPVALEDAGGFTVWRIGTIAAVLIGTWALLTATRITRGDEDAGRWDLLLAGRLRLGTAVGLHAVVLALAQALVGAGVVAAMAFAGTDVVGSLLYGTGLALIGFFFGALGMLAAQVVADRRTAAGLAVAGLGLALLLRMIADGSAATEWLRWLTPFGLLAKSEPYAAERVVPLFLLAITGGVLALLAMLATRGRDVGAGLVTVEDTRPPRIHLLQSLPRFAVRRSLRGLLAWATGLAAYFLLIGLLAVSLLQFLEDNPRFAELAAAAGFAELGTVEGYVAAIFVLLALPIGIYAAGSLATDASDETDRYLVMIFAFPVSRVRWSMIENAVVGVSCAVLAGVAGLATWIGTLVVGADLALGAALAGAFNALPVALLCLGAAQLALGWIPQAVLPIGALPAVGGFLLDALAESFGWPEWVEQLSPFAHVATVPAASPNWPGTLGILAVAVLLASVGAAGYARRDLRG